MGTNKSDLGISQNGKLLTSLNCWVNVSLNVKVSVQSLTNLQTETINQTDDNKYQVTSMTSTNKAYEVTILNQDITACSCADHYYSNLTCKHILEVLAKVLI